MSRLSRDFYCRETREVAVQLLGKRLVRIEESGLRLSGLIVETEAYVGPQDLGCHGRSGRTPRNDSLWGGPGLVYVYFTYGMHWLFNLVTERENFPSAVLIRALLADEGIEVMRRRRPGRSLGELTNGPAKLCQALQIEGVLDGVDACNPDAPVFVEVGKPVSGEWIQQGPRIGLNSVPEPWKSIPWRFWIDPDKMNL